MTTSTFSVQDVINRMGDRLANYSTGQATTDAKVRAVDSAINYLKRKIGLPQDEGIYSFYYTQDVLYYNAPSDFLEAKNLFYNAASNNYPQQGRRWEYRPEEEIQVMTGTNPSNGNSWSDTVINGLRQVLMLGSNVVQGQLLESFDINLWTASGDANSATTDTSTFYQGTASEKFILTYSTGTGTLTSGTVVWNFTQLVQTNGYINLRVYLPTTNITNIHFRFLSSTGNYYDMTATAQANGTAFAINTWNQILFQISSATIVGSPNLSNINQFQIMFTIPSGFGTVAGFRVDDLYTTYPDKMDLVYFSNKKGTDVTGATNKSVLTATTDLLYYDYDYIEPIATQAAIYLFPQLKADPQWRQLYMADLMEWMKTLTKTNPRRRVNKFLRTRLGR